MQSESRSIIEMQDPPPAAEDPQPSTEGSRPSANPQLSFPRSPGETPRAFAAFMTYFNLGQARSLQAAAGKTGECLSTLKQWSTKFSWVERLHSFQSGVFAQQAHDQAQLQRKQAADWAARLDRFREQEWDAAQKLLSAAQCFLESFGDEQLGRMTLSQVSRALRISSEIARSALAGAELPVSSEPAVSRPAANSSGARSRVRQTAAASPRAFGSRLQFLKPHCRLIDPCYEQKSPG